MITQVASSADITIKTDTETLTLSSAELADMNEAEVIAAIEAFAPELAGIVFIHKNRSGSFCVVIGDEPAIWPEDAVDG